jgi:hypothetical protein
VSYYEADVTVSLAERQGHTVVIGTTGVGKTRLAELLIAQDIRRGDVVIVLDPKGDADLLKRIYWEAKLAGREADLLIFHLGFPAYSARYNPIAHFIKITQVATRITNALPSTGEAAAFKEFAWKYVNLVTRALEEMQLSPNKKEAIRAYVEYLLESRQDAVESDLLSDLAAACRLDRTYYDKITASVGPMLEKLTTGGIAELLSPTQNPEDKRPEFNWLDVIKDKKIVYVGMDALTDNVISSTVGNAMLSDLVSVAGHLNTVIMLRTKEARTVDMLLNQLPTVPILRVIPASHSTDNPHGDEGIFYQSTNEDRFGHAELKLIEQTDVLNLPKGQAFCLLEGGKLYKIRIPLPAKETVNIPQSIQELLQNLYKLN